MNYAHKKSALHVLVFKTNVHSRRKVRRLRPSLNAPSIIRWTVDTEDIDNVLRIEAREDIAEQDIIALVKKGGFLCEVLPD